MDSSQLVLVFASCDGFIQDPEQVFQTETSQFSKTGKFNCAGVTSTSLCVRAGEHQKGIYWLHIPPTKEHVCMEILAGQQHQVGEA